MKCRHYFGHVQIMSMSKEVDSSAGQALYYALELSNK